MKRKVRINRQKINELALINHKTVKQIIIESRMSESTWYRMMRDGEATVQTISMLALVFGVNPRDLYI